MQLKAPIFILKAVKELFPASNFNLRYSYSSDENVLTPFDTDMFEPAALQKIMDMCADEKNNAIAGVEFLRRRLKGFLESVGKEFEVKIGTLTALEHNLRVVAKSLPTQWLFSNDMHSLPYLIGNIEYNKAERDQPAYTVMELYYVSRGSISLRRLRWETSDLIKKQTVLEILASRGLMLETPELHEKYKADYSFYEEIRVKTGQQFIASEHYLASSDDSYRYSNVSVISDNIPKKLVMDDIWNERDEKFSKFSSVRFQKNVWIPKVEDEYQNVVVPVHFSVRVFSLTDHCNIIVPTTILKYYEWKKNLLDKLILPKDIKDLVSLLMASSRVSMSDIITGKTGGIFVMSTGDPGVGKTLTAEIFSESVERPLYIVQCSQLGLKVDNVEHNLQKVLRRAQRLGAILLIDEADVYVYERGQDIQQNAIVGVFLRTLEYYNGITFMTSNRADKIDDAILSRATAHIMYPRPTLAERQEIWKVISKANDLDFSESLVSDLSNNKRFNNVSGRDIKNLIRLAKLRIHSEGIQPSLNLFLEVSKFLPISPSIND